MKLRRITAISVCLIFILQCMTLTVGAAPDFTDVPDNAYYKDAVSWAVEKGITSGTGNGKFSPKMVCDRSQAVTFLWRAAGSPEPESTEMSFNDIPANAYYFQAVLWAVEKGITSGTGNGKFSPLMKCDRSQIVTFLWRTMNTPEISAENPFADVPSDAYYLNAVLWAVESGITSGTGNGKFSPKMSCDRSQIVTFLYRAFKESPHMHVFGEWETVIPAGCETEGSEERVCECGEKEIKSITATGHSFGEWVTVTPPTYNEPGTESRSCSICGDKEERSIPVIIPEPFVIKTQPVSADAAVGDSVEFLFETNGGKPEISYQWQVKYDNDFVDIESANTSDYVFTVTNEHRKHSAEFRCIATEANGEVLVSDTVTINYPLWFNYGEQNIVTAPDSTTLLEAVPSGGSAPFSYEWEVFSTESNEWLSVSSIARDELTGENTSSLSVCASGYIAEYYDTFRCKVTDSNGEYAYSPTASFTLNALAFADDLPAEITVNDIGDKVHLYIKLTSDFGCTPFTYKLEYFSTRRNRWVTIDLTTEESNIKDLTYLSDKEDRDYEGRYRITVTDSEGNTITSNTVLIIYK